MLTRTQRKKLESLTDDWQFQSDPDWRAGTTFLRLDDMGLCEMKLDFPPGRKCDVTTGPGVSVGQYWWTRRTPAGRAALNLKD